MEAKRATSGSATPAEQSTLDLSHLPAFLNAASRAVIEGAGITSIPVLRMPQNLSERLEWRIARYYRDLLFLFGLRDSQAKGYVFAEASWFTKKYDCDASTIRNWQKVLVQHGWLLSVGKGPQRRLIPLVHPRRVLSFFARFSRLFKGVFRGFWGRLSYSPDREESSNSNAAPDADQSASSPALPELDVDQLVVAHSLVRAGIPAETQACKILKQFGTEACVDQLEALPYRKIADPRNPGQTLFVSLRDKWPLPDGLINKREEEKRQEAKRAEQTAKRERELQRREAEIASRREAAQKAAQDAMDAVRAREAATDKTLLPVWDTMLAKLANVLNKPTWETHVRTLRGGFVEGDKVTLLAPAAFNVDWLNKRYTGEFAQVLSDLLKRSVFVTFVVG